MKESLVIVKVGGKIVEQPETLERLLTDFKAIPGKKLLVHGGGRSATAMASRLGIESKMVDGRRITDADMLDVVTMVYGGLVNKNIVAKLQAEGMNAIGLTGTDCNVMLSDKRPVKDIDYGFVGDVKEVNAPFLAGLIEKGIVPVLAPLTHDGKGQLLNTNADTIAGDVLQLCGNNPYIVMAVMCILASFVSEFVSDVGAGAVFFPIMYQQAEMLGCNPLPFIMSLMLCVTFSFASPIGSTTHMLVYGPGSFRFSDFARLGICMHIVLLVIALIIVNIIYPLY